MKYLYIILFIPLLASCSFNVDWKKTYPDVGSTTKMDNGVFLHAFRHSDGKVSISFSRDSLLLDEKKDFVEFEPTEEVDIMFDGDSIFFASGDKKLKVNKQNNQHFSFGRVSSKEFNDTSKPCCFIECADGRMSIIRPAQ